MLMSALFDRRIIYVGHWDLDIHEEIDISSARATGRIAEHIDNTLPIIVTGNGTVVVIIETPAWR